IAAPMSGRNAPSKPGAAVAKPSVPSAPAVEPKELEPSASSPSITWMAMASGDDMVPVNTDSKAPAKPKAKELSKPVMKSVQVTAPVTPPVVSIGPAPPSAQSPSVTWMAMAEDDDPLQRALAAVDAQDAASASSSSKPRSTKDRLKAVGASQSQSLRPEQVLA